MSHAQPALGPCFPLLTPTSFPRLTEARTRLTPSPLPICQIKASAGWCLKGHSLACSSYHTVLWRHTSVSYCSFTKPHIRF